MATEGGQEFFSLWRYLVTLRSWILKEVFSPYFQYLILPSTLHLFQGLKSSLHLVPLGPQGLKSSLHLVPLGSTSYSPEPSPYALPVGLSEGLVALQGLSQGAWGSAALVVMTACVWAPVLAAKSVPTCWDEGVGFIMWIIGTEEALNPSFLSLTSGNSTLLLTGSYGSLDWELLGIGS